jgi:hypothetical protein
VFIRAPSKTAQNRFGCEEMKVDTYLAHLTTDSSAGRERRKDTRVSCTGWGDKQTVAQVTCLGPTARRIFSRLRDSRRFRKCFFPFSELVKGALGHSSLDFFPARVTDDKAYDNDRPLWHSDDHTASWRTPRAGRWRAVPCGATADVASGGLFPWLHHFRRRDPPSTESLLKKGDKDSR